MGLWREEKYIALFVDIIVLTEISNTPSTSTHHRGLLSATMLVYYDRN